MHLGKHLQLGQRRHLHHGRPWASTRTLYHHGASPCLGVFEVTHRSKRRLFGLKGMAPLAAVVRPPCRPEPGRGRGRPPLIVEEPAPPPEPLPQLSPIEQRAFDYSDLEQSMAQLDFVLRETRRSLDVLTYGALASVATWPRR